MAAKRNQASEVSTFTLKDFEHKLEHKYTSRANALRSLGRMDHWSAEETEHAKRLVDEKFGESGPTHRVRVPVPPEYRDDPLKQILFKIQRKDYKSLGYCKRAIEKFANLSKKDARTAVEAAEAYFANQPHGAREDRDGQTPEPKTSRRGGGAGERAPAKSMTNAELGHALRKIDSHVEAKAARESGRNGETDEENPAPSSVGPRGSIRLRTVEERRRSVETLQHVFEYAVPLAEKDVTFKPYAESVREALRKAAIALAGSLGGLSAEDEVPVPHLLRPSKSRRGGSTT